MAGVFRVGKAVRGFPIFVEQIAIAQVGNARTSEVTQTSEGRRIRTETETQVEPITSTLQQRTVVRRTEEYEVTQMLGPEMACHHAIVVCATGHQASHAVGKDRELFQWFWPLLE